jgi:hypothetical protein
VPLAIEHVLDTGRALVRLPDFDKSNSCSGKPLPVTGNGPGIPSTFIHYRIGYRGEARSTSLKKIEFTLEELKKLREAA